MQGSASSTSQLKTGTNNRECIKGFECLERVAKDLKMLGVGGEGGLCMNRRKVGFMGKQPETLETIFNPEEEQEGNRNKNRNSPKRDRKQKGATARSKWKDGEKNRS